MGLVAGAAVGLLGLVLAGGPTDPNVPAGGRVVTGAVGWWPEFSSPFSAGVPFSEPARGGTPSSALSAPGRKQVASAYGRLPLSFEHNEGQAAAGVKFVSRGAGYALALTDRGPLLSLAGPRSRIGGRAGSSGAVLATAFVGGRAHPRVVGSGRLGGRVNYLTGKDPSRWHTDVATYAHVTYVGVWKGIDVAFHGSQRQLEYDYRLAPGANPHQIALRLSGARRLRLDRAGNLVIGVGRRSVRELAPRAYQTVGGARRPIASRFVIQDGHRVGVRVGRYDHHRRLVIDPALAYSTYLAAFSRARGIAVDWAGNAYVAGGTQSMNFPTTAGALQRTSRGNGDAFVAKLNAAGTALVYSTYLGGNGAAASAIAVDSAGNAYLTGRSTGSFPTTIGAFQRATGGGHFDAFVTKLNATGTALSYSTYLGGGDDDGGTAIAVDPAGNAYVTGDTRSANFPTTAGAFQTASGGNGDVFVAKLNARGRALSYSSYLGGSDTEQSGGIAVDSVGNADLGGGTQSTNFPTTNGAFQRTSGGYFDAFLAKVDATGTALSYSTYLGGTSGDGAAAIAVDPAGNAYVTGDTQSTNFPTTAGAFQTARGGNGDVFVAKLDAGRAALSYSTYLGRSENDAVFGVAVDSAGNAYLTGFASMDFPSTYFPTTRGALQRTNGGDVDAFLAKLDATGSGLSYSTYLGGNDGDDGAAIAVDPAGNAYLTGGTQSTNFPTTAKAFQTAGDRNGDTFVTKIATAAAARVRISSASARVSAHGGTSVTLTCGRGSGRCRGTVALSTRVRIRVDHGRATRPKTITLAKARYSIIPVRRAKITLRLTRTGRRLLSHAPHHRLRVSATANHAHRQVTLTLQPKRPPRRHR